MQHRAIALGLGLLCSIGLVACQSTGDVQTTEIDTIERATSAYRAYGRGDCDAVRQGLGRERIEGWEPSELRHSMLLVHAFCEELAGEDGDAVETYRGLIREAPLSFASEDARERLRILRLERNDPAYAEWVAAAGERVSETESSRTAVERVPAEFPPLAQRAGIEGFAVVEFGVTPRGDTDAPVIVDSQPPLLFDGAALRAVREWRYTPEPEATSTARQAIRIVFMPEDDPRSPDEPSPEPTESAERPSASSPTLQ